MSVNSQTGRDFSITWHRQGWFYVNTSWDRKKNGKPSTFSFFFHTAVKWSSSLTGGALRPHTHTHTRMLGREPTPAAEVRFLETRSIWPSYMQCSHGMHYTAVWVMGRLELQFKCDFRSALRGAPRVKCCSLFCHLAACLSSDTLRVPCLHGSVDRQPCAPPFSPPPSTPNLGLAPPAVECIRPQNGSSAAAVAHGEKPDRLSSCWRGWNRARSSLRMKFIAATC